MPKVSWVKYGRSTAHDTTRFHILCSTLRPLGLSFHAFPHRRCLFQRALTLQAHLAPPSPCWVRGAWNGIGHVADAQQIFINEGWKAVFCRALGTGVGRLPSNNLREAGTGVRAAQRRGNQQRHQAKAPSNPKPHDFWDRHADQPIHYIGSQREHSDPLVGQPGVSRVPVGNAGPPVFPIQRNTALLDTPKASPPSSDAASILLVFTQQLILLLLFSPASLHPTHQKLIPWKLSLGAISTSYYARCASPAQCYLAPYSREDS